MPPRPSSKPAGRSRRPSASSSASGAKSSPTLSSSSPPVSSSTCLSFIRMDKERVEVAAYPSFANRQAGTDTWYGSASTSSSSSLSPPTSASPLLSSSSSFPPSTFSSVSPPSSWTTSTKLSRPSISTASPHPHQPSLLRSPSPSLSNASNLQPHTFTPGQIKGEQKRKVQTSGESGSRKRRRAGSEGEVRKVGKKGETGREGRLMSAVEERRFSFAEDDDGEADDGEAKGGKVKTEEIVQAIYPDTVSWTLLPPSVALPHGSVEVRVKLAVELEEEVEVEVKDWVAPLPPSPRSLAVAELGDTLEGLAVKEEPASGRKKRKRGGGGKGRGGKALAGDAAPFRLHTPSRIAPAAPAPRSAVARPAPPVPPSPTSLPPPLTSNGKTPRISFTPRPASPPPPTPSVDLSPAPVLDPAVPKRLSLQYLPPLELRVVLPPSYPDETGPVELSVTEQDETRVGWLDAERRGVVEDRCRTAHNVGEELLLDLLDLLTSPSPAFASLFSLTPPLSFTQPPPAFPPPSLTPLSTSLSTFNALSCTLIFTLRSHPCPLCFTPVSGTRCIALQSCGHVFCRACLTSYFGVLIGEGLVRSVACPDVGCVKERAMEEREGGGRGAEEVERTGAVSREEVESLCGEEKAVRWEWLREKVRVESDPTIAFCPISSCQSPVPKLEDEEKLRVCPKCSFSFCMFCRLTWHGTRNPCALPQSSAIVNAYVRGDALTRAGLELRYGAAVLKRLVEANEEEKALEKWLSENATRCPGCDTPIEKSAGCNHVECYRCKSHLCFRCGKSIPPTDPYKHFSTPGLGCYGRLFDFTPGNEPAVEEWIGEFLDDDEAGGH